MAGGRAGAGGVAANTWRQLPHSTSCPAYWASSSRVVLHAGHVTRMFGMVRICYGGVGGGEPAGGGASPWRENPVCPPLPANDRIGLRTWRGGRVVECVGLENRCTSNGTEGSNPSLSAVFRYQLQGFLGFRLSPPLHPTRRRIVHGRPTKSVAWR